MDLYYKEYGEGQGLIILHGLFGLSDNWVSVARKMAGNYHVFVPDLRNHGQSPHSPYHSYPAMAEDILEFIDKQKIKDPILMGHSMGGKVAMLLATENPSLINKLIVIDISPKLYNLRDQHLDILQVMMDTDLMVMKSRLEIQEYIASQIEDVRIRLFILKNLYRPARDRFAWRINLPAIFDNLDLLAIGPELTMVYTKPTLFVRGGKSDYITDEDIPRIMSFFPKATLVTIENAGHWVHADEPSALCRQLSLFMSINCEYNPNLPV